LQESRHNAKVIHAHHVVGMGMSVQEGMDDMHLGPKQLGAQVWGRVNQQVAAGRANQHRTTQAMIARVR
jgi:hypothetical protein